MEFDERRVENWLIILIFFRYTEIHVYRTCVRRPELLDMIREIQPEILYYPVHTIFKERFKVLEDDGIRVVYPKLSENYVNNGFLAQYY